MSSNNTCAEGYKTEPSKCKNNNGFLIVIVLYILLAIILGSYLY